MGVEVNSGAHPLQEDPAAIDFFFAVNLVPRIVASRQQWIFFPVLHAGEGFEEIGADFHIVLQIGYPFHPGISQPVVQANVQCGGETAVVGQMENTDAK